MEYFYLLFAILSTTLLSVLNTIFSRQNSDAGNCAFLYNTIATGFAFILWGIILLKDGGFDTGVIAYSAMFGIFFTMAMTGMFKAYELGPVSLTAFAKQLSLIGVAVWGFIFWGNPLTPNITIGMLLIIAALYLCFKPEKGASEKGLSLKWFFFSSMLFVGNAGCSIVQKYQQMAFDGKHGSLLMFFGVGMSFVFSLVLFLKDKQCQIHKIKKISLLCPIVGGICSALLNLSIILMISSPLSESIIFPGIAVGGLGLTTLYSLVAYHEKLRTYQWYGLGIGAIALIFLNL
ncbi:MAG: hypothetical protein J6V93_04400 [Clostridia bacterium]|nr:hypothetical protein [Clostridia bacterium]